MKRFLGIVLILALLAGGGYYWWTTTPVFAVQQAATAVKNHDVGAFHNWVDVHSVSSAAMNDMVAEPMKRIGAPSILGRVIGLSILGLFAPAAVDSLDRQIDGWVAHRGHPSQPASSGDDRVYGTGSGSGTNPPPYSGGSPLPFGTTPQQAQSSGVGSGSDNGDDDDDSAAQPKGFFGALVSMVKPPSLKQTFHDYGFTRKNFRGIGDYDTQGNMAHVGLKFFSPKLNREIQIVLELDHNTGHWQVTRISNLQSALSLLAEADSSGRLTPESFTRDTHPI